MARIPGTFSMYAGKQIKFAIRKSNVFAYRHNSMTAISLAKPTWMVEKRQNVD